jgi:hypothetical protein
MYRRNFENRRHREECEEWKTYITITNWMKQPLLMDLSKRLEIVRHKVYRTIFSLSRTNSLLLSRTIN